MRIRRKCSLINDCGIKCFPHQGPGPNKKLVVELAICIILWHEKSPIKRPDAILRVTDKRQNVFTDYRIIIVCEHRLKKNVRTRKF